MMNNGPFEGFWEVNEERYPGTFFQLSEDHEVIQESHINRSERTKYYNHGTKARCDPDKYLSITINRMDQGKHDLLPLTKEACSSSSNFKIIARISVRLLVMSS